MLVYPENCPALKSGPNHESCRFLLLSHDRISAYDDRTGRRIIGKKYISDADASKSGACKKCLEYANRIFRWPEEADKMPKLPLHPNCKCHYEDVYEEKSQQSGGRGIIRDAMLVSNKNLSMKDAEKLESLIVSADRQMRKYTRGKEVYLYFNGRYLFSNNGKLVLDAVSGKPVAVKTVIQSINEMYTAAKSALSAGKLAAIIGSTAAVVAVVTGTTIAILKHEPASEQQTVNQTNTTITTADSTITEDIDTENTTLLCQAEEVQISPAKETTVTPSQTKDATEETVNSPINSDIQTSTTTPVPVTPSLTTNNSSGNTASASGLSSNTNTASTADKNSANNSSSQTSNNNTPDKTNQNQDVVLNNQKEEWSFVQPVIIEIPNIFTPNGDGVNDHFVINGLENCEKKMLIVKDRSGQIVFQSRSYDNSWDGGNLPDGSYYYQFSYSINNINELRQGAILIRR